MQVPNMPGGGAGRIRTRGGGKSAHALLSRPVRPSFLAVSVNRAFPLSIRRDRRSSFYMDKPL